MRGLPWELLIQTARKKPHLMELVNRVDEMSEEEISSLDVRPWIKKGLLQLQDRNRQGYGQLTKARYAIVDFFTSSPEAIAAHEATVNPTGTVYRLNSPLNFTSRSPRGVEGVLELITGDLLFEEKDIWHYAEITGTIRGEMKDLVIRHSTVVGSRTYREYRSLHREVENARQQ